MMQCKAFCKLSITADLHEVLKKDAPRRRKIREKGESN